MQPNLWQQLTHQSNKDHQLNEFSKKYVGSYMLYSDPDYPDGVIVYVRHDPSEDAAHAVYHPAFGNIPLYYESDQEVSPFFPEPGSFTHCGRYFVGKRIPERQYLKSVSDQSYYPQEILKSIIRPQDTNGFFAIAQRDGAYSMLEDAINPKYYNFAFRLSMPSSWSGYALNREWGITLHPTNNSAHLLWHNGSVIAEVIGNNISLVNGLLKQEVLDFVRDNHIDGVVM